MLMPFLEITSKRFSKNSPWAPSGVYSVHSLSRPDFTLTPLVNPDGHGGHSCAPWRPRGPTDLHEMPHKVSRWPPWTSIVTTSIITITTITTITATTTTTITTTNTITSTTIYTSPINHNHNDVNHHNYNNDNHNDDNHHNTSTTITRTTSITTLVTFTNRSQL